MASRLRRFDEALKAKHGAERLIGVDEAGRGPLAGPVVVAAVRLAPGTLSCLDAARDSKRLVAHERDRLFALIRENAEAVSVAWAYPREIERLNILAATLSAMRRAVERIADDGSLIVIDGNRRIPGLARKHITIVGGDDRSLSIACASIVAKVVRDKWMLLLDGRYPGYGLARHKGYGTQGHLEALSRLGPSLIHRRTFAPVKEFLNSGN